MLYTIELICEFLHVCLCLRFYITRTLISIQYTLETTERPSSANNTTDVFVRVIDENDLMVSFGNSSVVAFGNH